MSEVVITVENLSKRYRLGERESYRALRDVLTGSFSGPLRKLFGSNGKSRQDAENQYMWALKDVSFEVKRGEVVGIIGRNGAGKSTLLKILSRITHPTSGFAEITGRVGSLLEVGTGFHPELTGRENIFLNGAILGMRKAEIKKKFEEIVDFSEVEKFLETPVKRYSSGMYVRLAFAVAAHLEPEILIVDEVLAVGDALFQKKCLEKMSTISSAGQTVLFVSHNMSAIASLCTKGILLKDGIISNIGEAITIVGAYLTGERELKGLYLAPLTDKSSKLKITRISLLKEGQVSTEYTNIDLLSVEIEYTVHEELFGAQIAIEVSIEFDQVLFSTTNMDFETDRKSAERGIFITTCPIDLTFFREGRYRIKVTSSIPGIEMLDGEAESLTFDVVEIQSPMLKLGQNRRGLILPRIKWTTRRYETNQSDIFNDTEENLL
jgi:lipopolysaccharide transport system ATP-binding protein